MNRAFWVRPFGALATTFEAVAKQADELCRTTDGAIGLLQAAKSETELAAGKMPDVVALGLKVLETSRRDTRALPTTEPILPAGAKWWDDRWACRLPIKLQFGEKAVTDYPVEVAVNFGEVKPDPTSLRAVEYTSDGQMVAGLAQLIALAEGKTSVAFIAPGESKAKSTRVFALYYDAAGDKPALTAPTISAKSEGGWITVENDRYRIVVGSPGAHLYEWFVKALGNLEITEPGRGGWSGFSDTGDPDRGGAWALQLEAAGPVLVRIKATAQAGSNEKTLTFYAGRPYAEIMLARPMSFYWDYDSVSNFAADQGTPGTALFSNGHREPVCRSDETKHAIGYGTTWSAKTRADGLLLANLTPEVAATHMTGPGGGWGGVGIEGGAPAAHFVTLADKIEGDLAALLNTVQQTLDLRHQPQMWIAKAERR